MGTRYEASRAKFPATSLPTDPASKSYTDAAAGGSVPLGSLYRPMTGVWPVVDATNGPLTADAGTTNTAPSFTGLTLFSWNSGAFNTQSQNWVAVPSSNGPSTNQCCQNVTTPRGTNYASTGIGFPCHSDFSFVTDTTKIIIAYYQTTTGMANLGISSSYHESQVFVEHEGQMKGIRSAPNVWPNGSGGNQMFYRVITFKEARRREFRVMLSVGCWFAGVYVDTGAFMQKAPNRPILMGCFGDSWAEGAGNVWSSVGGNGSQAGVTWPTGCSLLYSNTALQWCVQTGGAAIIGHQGGTGYFNANGSGLTEDSTTAGFTVFASQGQVDFFWNTFGSRYPMAGVFGGWNDGTTPVGAPILTNYQARVDKVLRKILAKDAAIPLLVEGIQCKSIGVGDGRDLSNQGIAAAVAALQATYSNVMPFINDIADRNYVDIWTADIGPDGLHPTVKGGDNIGAIRAKKSANFMVARTRINQILAA